MQPDFKLVSNTAPAPAATGFTLIEAIIILVMLGILSAIAIPSFSRYASRGRLVEATNALIDYHARMERFHREHRSYSRGNECGAVPPTNLSGFKLGCTVGADGGTYIATATGVGTTAGFAYTIDQSNVRATVALPESWGELPDDARNRWVTR